MKVDESVVDCPTQLICNGFGYSFVELAVATPCGAADFCVSGPHGQEKQAGSNFFSKYPNHV